MCSLGVSPKGEGVGVWSPWVLGSPPGRVWGFAGSPPGRDFGIGAPHAGPGALLGAPCAEIGALEPPGQDLGLFWSPPRRAGGFAGVRHAGSGQHGCGHPRKSACIPLLVCDPLLPPPGLFFFDFPRCFQWGIPFPVLPGTAREGGAGSSPLSWCERCPRARPSSSLRAGQGEPGIHSEFSAVGTSSGCDPCRPAA